MVFNQVRQRRLSDDIVERLEGMILEGTLTAGARLPAERQLAEQFGVSRPSLREAIQKLVAKGMLVSRQGGGNYVAESMGSTFSDPLLQLLSAHAFVARTYGLKEERLCKVKQYHHPKKRIGFASGDLREHAVGFLLPTMLQGLDRERYEVYAYDFTTDDGSEHRKKLLGMFDHVRPVHTLTDRQAAERILEDEIDVMVDLHGLSAGARPGIFALHPAPKQGTYLGFIGTTGMPWFDFVITDRHALPPEHTEYFMEKPLYVEGSFIPLTPPDENLPVVTRNDVGLPEDAFVMGAFGNVYKITPEMFGVWMNLLKEIPDSVLWLIDDNPTTTENLKNQAKLANTELYYLAQPQSLHSSSSLLIRN